jgi:hypothetical protein
MIFLDYPTEWLNELLRRSEPLLIDVEWTEWSPFFNDCLLDRSKYEFVSRFRSCKLIPATERQWNPIGTAFQVLSTPHLSELQLTFRTLHHDVSRPIFPSSALQQLNAPSPLVEVCKSRARFFNSQRTYEHQESYRGRLVSPTRNY